MKSWLFATIWRKWLKDARIVRITGWRSALIELKNGNRMRATFCVGRWLTILCAVLLSTASHGQVTCMSCDCNPALCDQVKPPPTSDRPGKKPKKSTTTTTSTVRGKGTVK